MFGPVLFVAAADDGPPPATLVCGADPTVATTCAVAVDGFATDFVNNARKETPAAVSVRMQTAHNPNLFATLMAMIFQVCCFLRASCCTPV